MSKVGKKIIVIPEDIKVTLSDATLLASGKNGSLEVPILSGITPKIEGNELSFIAKDETKQTLANWGTMRALSQNAISGAGEDFVKELKIEGVGYKANLDGNTLVLSVGYSHQVKMLIPDGLKIVAEKNIVKVFGRNKEAVGSFAAKVRAVRKPEPYKGTGIMYVNEVIRRKAGKKVAGSGK